PDQPGVWKIKKDGSNATHLVSAFTDFPETSPDGQYISYTNSTSPGSYRWVRFVKIDGSKVPFEIHLKSTLGLVGRSRWLSNDKIAFVDGDEKGLPGIYVQDFVPGKDTASTRRLLTAYDASTKIESFGISPDGSHVTISTYESSRSLVAAENVAGVS